MSIFAANDSTALTASAYDNRITYTGRRLDAEIGLYYFRARYYDPCLGSFLGRDPSGYVDGGNLYQYVRSNPWNLCDPTGLCSLNSSWYNTANAIGAGTYWGLTGDDSEWNQWKQYHPSQEGGQLGNDIYEGSMGVAAGAVTIASGGLAADIGFSLLPAATQSAIASLAASTGGQLVIAGASGFGFGYSVTTGVQDFADGNYYGAGFNLALSIGSGLGMVDSIGGSSGSFSGHGAYSSDAGMLTIPQGSSLTIWQRFGSLMPDEVGGLIESGQEMQILNSPAMQQAITGARTYLPGAQVPNFTLYPPNGSLNILGSPVTVIAPVPLSQLMEPGMGNMNWAACQKILGTFPPNVIGPME